MTRKTKQKTVRLGRCTVQIKYSSADREYRVIEKIGKAVTGGKAGGGYFTTDAADARGTAAAMIKSLRRRGVC